ncbi:hypothetical protein PV762_13005 [Mitsuaria sp. CC2]|uniref:hypothetical protein n=1 Tax=Mitsuaria sp. CC2 TaxID=3029186 RepID=UPI003B8E9C54
MKSFAADTAELVNRMGAQEMQMQGTQGKAAAGEPLVADDSPGAAIDGTRWPHGAELLKATKDAIATVTKDLPPR